MKQRECNRGFRIGKGGAADFECRNGTSEWYINSFNSGLIEETLTQHRTLITSLGLASKHLGDDGTAEREGEKTALVGETQDP